MRRFWKGSAAAFVLALILICAGCACSRNGAVANDPIPPADNHRNDAGSNGDEMNDNAQYGADNGGHVDGDGANSGDIVGDTDTADGRKPENTTPDGSDKAVSPEDPAGNAVEDAADAVTDAARGVINGARNAVDSITGR